LICLSVSGTDFPGLVFRFQLMPFSDRIFQNVSRCRIGYRFSDKTMRHRQTAGERWQYWLDSDANAA